MGLASLHAPHKLTAQVEEAVTDQRSNGVPKEIIHLEHAEVERKLRALDHEGEKKAKERDPKSRPEALDP